MVNRKTISFTTPAPRWVRHNYSTKVLVHNGVISGCSQVPWASNTLFTDNTFSPTRSETSLLYTQLCLKPSDINSSLHSYVLCIGILFLRRHFQPVAPLNIPYPHFPWGFDAPNFTHVKCPCSCPVQIWDPSQTISLSSFQSWLSEMYEMEVLQGQKSAFYAYSREERNGHPVPPRHFYSWAQTRPCWLSSCGWNSTPVPPFRKDIAGSQTMKLKASCCK